MSSFHKLIRRKQFLMLGIAIFAVLSLLAGIMWAMSEGRSPSRPPSLVKTSDIESAGTRVNPQEVWVERMENEAKLTKERINQLEKLLMESIAQSSKKDLDIEYLQGELKEAHNLNARKSEEQAGAVAADINLSQGLPAGNPSFEGYPVSPLRTPEQVSSTGIKKIVLNLRQNSRTSRKNRKTVENTIPAGAHARAIILGGVDASTSINAQSDPRPVLLRILDHGTLPRRFKSDLKSCYVTASSYGDLSGERVYMRLEKLSCIEPLTGEIVETQVAGHVTGEDGRAGLRGTIVDKAGDTVRNALVGGFFSGMSQFLGAQQQSSVYPVSPFGQTNALSPQRMLGAGVAHGFGNAMEQYATFFIKRAEQLQPVIQVAAGRMVDIVFTQGTAIGDTSVKQALHKIREESRRETVDELQGSPDDKKWLPQAELNP